MSIYLKCGSLDGLKGFPGSDKIHDMEKEMNYQFTPSQLLQLWPKYLRQTLIFT